VSERSQERREPAGRGLQPATKTEKENSAFYDEDTGGAKGKRRDLKRDRGGGTLREKGPTRGINKKKEKDPRNNTRNARKGGVTGDTHKKSLRKSSFPRRKEKKSA